MVTILLDIPRPEHVPALVREKLESEEDDNNFPLRRNPNIKVTLQSSPVKHN